eukprot:Nk52_evm12s283 gene=Nk52_evmTU12s283
MNQVKSLSFVSFVTVILLLGSLIGLTHCKSLPDQPQNATQARRPALSLGQSFNSSEPNLKSTEQLIFYEPDHDRYFLLDVQQTGSVNANNIVITKDSITLESKGSETEQIVREVEKELNIIKSQGISYGGSDAGPDVMYFGLGVALSIHSPDGYGPCDVKVVLGQEKRWPYYRWWIFPVEGENNGRRVGDTEGQLHLTCGEYGDSGLTVKFQMNGSNDVNMYYSIDGN